jgi:GntR family transcriptional repressor for pyruvate dehydrogenase complex
MTLCIMVTMCDMVVTSVRRHDKVGQLVAREILHKITTLEPGAQLPAEAQMMTEYQVGRGTLREALRILEVNGLIAIRPGPGGGPVVQEASTHDFGRMASLFFCARGVTLRDLMEARLIMEPVAARLAAERRDRGSLEWLKSQDFEEGSDGDSYLEKSSDFHRQIAVLAGNGVVSLFCQSLAEVFYSRVAGSLFPRGKARTHVARIHAQIAAAIVESDGDTAEKLMYEHMAEYAKYLHKTHPTIIDEVIDWLG